MALYGVDISKFQSVGVGDNGKDFVIAKATEGVGYVDPNCDPHYQRALSQGKLLGIYHFARPDKNNAIAEAEFFLKNIKGYIGKAMLILDWEVNTWNVAWAEEWLNYVHEKTGIYPLIYMSASVVSSYNWSNVAKNCGLWIAGYPSKYNVKNPPTPAENEMPYSIKPWKFVAMWQYTSSANTLDRDIAYMDKKGWEAYAGIKPQVVEVAKTEVKQETKTDSKPVEVKVEEKKEEVKPVETIGQKEDKKPSEDNSKVEEQPDSTDKGLTVEELEQLNKIAEENMNNLENIVEEAGKGFDFPKWVKIAAYLIGDLLLAAGVLVPSIVATINAPDVMTFTNSLSSTLVTAGSIVLMVFKLLKKK